MLSGQVDSGLSMPLDSIGLIDLIGSTSGTTVSLDHLFTARLPYHITTAVITMTAFGTGINGYAAVIFIDQELVG